MREILFRGKRIDNGQWVEGAFCQKDCDSPFGDMVDRPSIIKYEDPFSGFWFQVDPDTVGQYTGLTDKNGRKVFEGDVLDHTIQAEVLTNRGIVAWDSENARWALQLNTMKPCFYMHNTKAVEVIGNIHDNPELLDQ